MLGNRELGLEEGNIEGSIDAVSVGPKEAVGVGLLLGLVEGWLLLGLLLGLTEGQ